MTNSEVVERAIAIAARHKRKTIDNEGIKALQNPFHESHGFQREVQGIDICATDIVNELKRFAAELRQQEEK